MRITTQHQGIRLASLTLVGLGLLTACGDDSGSSAEQSDDVLSQAAAPPGRGGEFADLLEGLESGESMLSLSDSVTSTGEYTTANDPRYGGVSHDIFRPSLGGGASRRGSNAEGPYAITIYTDATHQDQPDNVVRAWATLVLPKGAAAGNRYAVASFADAEDDQTQAHVRGDGMAWTFAHQVSGSIYLDALGDSVTAAWQFEAADGRGEDASRVHSDGAVRDLALTLQAEAEYDLTVNGETESSLARISNHDNTLIIGNGIYLTLPSAVAAGSYPIRGSRDEDSVRARFTRHEVEEISGELTLAANGERYDAEINIAASGEDDIELAGELRWFTLEEE